MESYGTEMFRRLTETDVLDFRAAADNDYDEATGEIVVNAIHHPIYRQRIAERVAEDAKAEIRELGNVGKLP